MMQKDDKLEWCPLFRLQRNLVRKLLNGILFACIDLVWNKKWSYGSLLFKFMQRAYFTFFSILKKKIFERMSFSIFLIHVVLIAGLFNQRNIVKILPLSVIFYTCTGINNFSPFSKILVSFCVNPCCQSFCYSIVWASRRFTTMK